MPTRSIPWPRILAEGFAIVVSILLAFGIQAWWEGQQSEQERLELFATMLESVRLNQASLAENIRGSESNLELAVSFYSRQPSELSDVPHDSASIIMNSLLQPNTFQFSGGPLSRALERGGLRPIEDSDVLAALDEWQVQVTELEERARVLVEAEIAVERALAAHEIVQLQRLQQPGRRVPMAGRPSGARVGGMPPVVDLGALRSDADLIQAVTALTIGRGVYLTFAGQLQSNLDRLEGILSSRLE